MFETNFLTIRQAAATGLLTEYHLRLLAKQGKLPGIYSCNRFKVNMQLLMEQLNQASAAVEGETRENF